jgi:hypothetical protein
MQKLTKALTGTATPGSHSWRSRRAVPPRHERSSRSTTLWQPPRSGTISRELSAPTENGAGDTLTGTRLTSRNGDVELSLDNNVES